MGLGRSGNVRRVASESEPQFDRTTLRDGGPGTGTHDETAKRTATRLGRAEQSKRNTLLPAEISEK
jgi:hypothetical protein